MKLLLYNHVKSKVLYIPSFIISFAKPSFSYSVMYPSSVQKNNLCPSLELAHLFNATNFNMQNRHSVIAFICESPFDPVLL